MAKCKECGSHAINHSDHGRDGSDPDLCDVCFWRKRASGFDDLSTAQAEPVQPVFAVNEQMLDALVKTKAWLDAEENPTWSQIFTIDAECAPKLKA